MPVVDVREKLNLVSEHWAPKVVARLNDYEVKVVKLKGEFVRHTHDDTDELFLVIDGDLTIQLRDGEVTLGPGQLYVVPRGVEHRPIAQGEVAAMLIEPAGVVNTGHSGGDLTAPHDETLLTEMWGRETRPLSTYDISEIATWVDSNDYAAAYLDPATGEVYPSFEGMGPLDEDGERIDLDDTDWVPIGGASSHAAYQDMEIFAESVADPAVRRQLQGALGGRGVFRRFRDVMWHQPAEVSGAWGAYRDLGSELRALEWLVDEGLVSEKDAREARATREAAQRDLLDSVGGSTRARLILLNGMPGAGKSTLAERFLAEHPGVLLCDPDRLRPMIGGDPEAAVEAVRSLALAMASAHLLSGHDVVMPQLVADKGQLERFVAAAEEGGGRLVMVLLVGDHSDGGERYARGLEEIVLRERPPEVVCSRGDVAGSYERLLAVLADET